MKRNSCQAILAFLLITILVGCQDEAAPGPQFTAESTKSAVIGKWSISKIDYQLCRSGHCNKSSYAGKSQDYFEMRADSAILIRKGNPVATQAERFKAYYTLPGAFILIKGNWTGRFDVKECSNRELVLINNYTGTDPNAVFKDTYYLYRK